MILKRSVYFENEKENIGLPQDSCKSCRQLFQNLFYRIDGQRKDSIKSEKKYCKKSDMGNNIIQKFDMRDERCPTSFNNFSTFKSPGSLLIFLLDS